MSEVLVRPPIATVVQQHAEECAMLRHIRSVLVRAPHVRLRHLRRLDDRIAAHADGLAVAGAYGTRLCTEALERVGAGVVFALALRVIDERDDRALQRLVALAAAVPEAQRGLLSAFGWVSAAQLQGIVRALLAADDAQRRGLGIAACRLHRVDPGALLGHAVQDESPALRAAAWRAAGELGRTDLLEPALAALADPDRAAAFEAARCACRLGDRHEALGALLAIAGGAGEHGEQAWRLLLLATEFGRARELVRQLAQSAAPDAKHRRRVMAACALLGDTGYVPWLIECMGDLRLARLAGEAFSLLTGADLAALDLERKPPENLPGGPTEDAEDDDVDLDPDESLPWPDPERVLRWWQAHAAALPAQGRCFMGKPPDRAHCGEVLREGFQRQRFIAADLLVLCAPGHLLFPVGAPSWRQQRLLAT
ncbi:TIGR02270 family protein [Ramlibacter monticola]|uniref:TIGR02270 family protein n=1 Tax=Ramlibacter monticola TaxID=1926872 RepID=A0A936Z2S7_9BURK|nr:TIGR02270 family protein [Ramlibacter monticola]MBL0392834.1 TIGR02270 family protein [Ramlibacter monticola]